MNLLDTAAAKYGETLTSFSVHEDKVVEEGMPNEWIVKDASGRIVRTVKPITTQAEADTFRDETARRAAVIAVVREIVSPDRLSRAAFIAGCDLRKFDNNRVNMGKRPALALLEGLILAIQEAS